ncbi:hypothetical protein CCP4SC76_1220006 [Gammaproteobacteria bacterium]
MVGNVTIGSSQATIQQGDIGKLSIVASGASVTRIETLANMAKIDARGASKVFLQGSRDQPQLKQSGAAGIHVGR